MQTRSNGWATSGRIPDPCAGLPDLAAPVEANWSRAVAGQVFSATEEHGGPARCRRSCQRRFEPVHDREGRIPGAYQDATDITDQVGDQRQANEAQEPVLVVSR